MTAVSGIPKIEWSWKSQERNHVCYLNTKNKNCKNVAAKVILQIDINKVLVKCMSQCPLRIRNSLTQSRSIRDTNICLIQLWHFQCNPSEIVMNYHYNSWMWFKILNLNIKVLHIHETNPQVKNEQDCLGDRVTFLPHSSLKPVEVLFDPWCQARWES